MSHAETGLYIGGILTNAKGGQHLAIHTSVYRQFVLVLSRMAELPRCLALHRIASLIEKSPAEREADLLSFRESGAICKNCIDTLKFYLNITEQVYIWICMSVCACSWKLFFTVNIEGSWGRIRVSWRRMRGSWGRMRGSWGSTLHLKSKLLCLIYISAF